MTKDGIHYTVAGNKFEKLDPKRAFFFHGLGSFLGSGET